MTTMPSRVLARLFSVDESGLTAAEEWSPFHEGEGPADDRP
ncbi:hypothetical protein [Nocardiopsis lambiniae]|uniref:Uncharacterized protein n=1 Tax=Nocardiopsis lambiniae TaxID=3075539 RepID=A0ABU2MAJ3_9ACTN|nr:hypothetical protein [Nocardiopsis sp. DSM 44743]MDT0328986.1 hypothetical protein [Nocardiopsis sp. DSM 44743]